jgi:hypothetical protein
MNPKVTLTIASVLMIALLIFHVSDEIARGMEIGGLNMITPMAVVAAWLYVALIPGERRWTYAVLLLGSILGFGIPVLHMSGRGLIGGRIAAGSDGAFFWVVTNVTIGVIAGLSLILAAAGLWRTRRGRMTPP